MLFLLIIVFLFRIVKQEGRVVATGKMDGDFNMCYGVATWPLFPFSKINNNMLPMIYGILALYM